MSIAGYELCASIFKEAEKHHPDLMEPYATRLAGADDAAQRLAIMRQGLAETFRRRFPMPEVCWSTPCTPDEIAAWDNHVAKVLEQRRVARERFARAEASAHG